MDLDSLSYVELRSVVAVGLGQFFSRLDNNPLIIYREDLPPEMRGSVKKALRILRLKSVVCRWVDHKVPPTESKIT